MFTVVEDMAVRVQASEPLRSMYTLSPYVWRASDRFEMLLRAVNRDPNPLNKIARVYHGRSTDGLTFDMDLEPDLKPGPGPDDRDGCEDPSVAIDGDRLFVYYTGWNQRKKQGKLLLAIGGDPCHLHKSGVALESTATHANPKEATIARCPDGTWVLLFEYAHQDRSRIGLARSACVDGPWKVLGDPLVARDAGWDGWHLSPGPVMPYGSQVMMFYNGANHKAAWRIGWVVFDATFSTVVARAAVPFIVPPPPVGDDTDIAFVSSAVAAPRGIWLYYSIADRNMKRATLQ